MSDSSCRIHRELIGVYVLGAIEPAERALIDSHLGQCADCRAELADLALLPALMHRVPAEEAERLHQENPAAAGPVTPSPELLPALMRTVGARKRRSRVRSAFAIAAAILVAAGGGAAVASQALAPPQAPTALNDVATARLGGLDGTVRYGGVAWGPLRWGGTTMSVRVTGIPPGTWCEFWVVSRGGHRTLAGGWFTGPDGGRLWYPVLAGVPKAQVTAFVITVAGSQLLRIPAP